MNNLIKKKSFCVFTLFHMILMIFFCQKILLIIVKLLLFKPLCYNETGLIFWNFGLLEEETCITGGLCECHMLSLIFVNINFELQQASMI